MRYVDTSVLVSYLTPEPHSKIADAFMQSAGTLLAISSWTEVELYSALGIKLRTGQLNTVQLQDVLDNYQKQVSPQLYRLPALNQDHRLAKILITGWRTTLRAGDSLHLAIALAHNSTVYTLDRKLAIAGPKLGVPVILL